MWFKKKEGSQTDKETASAKPAVTPEAVRTKLVAFVCQRTKLVQAADVADDTALFSSGLLDSLAFIQMVSHLETNFGVKLNKAGAVTITALDTPAQIIAAVFNSAT